MTAYRKPSEKTASDTAIRDQVQEKKPHSPPRQPEPALYMANVPVKISIGHGETIIDEYEDVIDIEMTETTPEGRHNIAMFLFLTKEKGLSTEEALFTIASEAVKEETQRIVSTVTTPTHLELHLHVKRNGEISYGKLG